MTCPECNQEMAKDVGGLCSLGGHGQPPISVTFNTHVCDCGGIHKAFMDDGRDLLQYWREHPRTVPPNYTLVGPATEDHQQSSKARHERRLAAARIEAVAGAVARGMENPA